MDIDLNLLRSAVTLVSMALFAAIVAWACSGRNAARFAQAAALPFGDDAQGQPGAQDSSAAEAGQHPPAALAATARQGHTGRATT